MRWHGRHDPGDSREEIGLKFVGVRSFDDVCIGTCCPRAHSDVRVVLRADNHDVRRGGNGTETLDRCDAVPFSVGHVQVGQDQAWSHSFNSDQRSGKRGNQFNGRARRCELYPAMDGAADDGLVFNNQDVHSCSTCYGASSLPRWLIGHGPAIVAEQSSMLVQGCAVIAAGHTCFQISDEMSVRFAPCLGHRISLLTKFALCTLESKSRYCGETGAHPSASGSRRLRPVADIEPPGFKSPDSGQPAALGLKWLTQAQSASAASKARWILFMKKSVEVNSWEITVSSLLAVAGFAVTNACAQAAANSAPTTIGAPRPTPNPAIQVFFEGSVPGRAGGPAECDFVLRQGGFKFRGPGICSPELVGLASAARTASRRVDVSIYFMMQLLVLTDELSGIRSEGNRLASSWVRGLSTCAADNVGLACFSLDLQTKVALAELRQRLERLASLAEKAERYLCVDIKSDLPGTEANDRRCLETTLSERLRLHRFVIRVQVALTSTAGKLADAQNAASTLAFTMSNPNAR